MRKKLKRHKCEYCDRSMPERCMEYVEPQNYGKSLWGDWWQCRGLYSIRCDETNERLGREGK